MDDTCQKYMLWMGTLIVNFQSLEFALRAFLYNDETNFKNNIEPKFLEKIKEGEIVPENAFTNFDGLKKLIGKYNAKMIEVNPDLCISEDLVGIRDALAHGRIASKDPSPEAPEKLVKYSNPKKGPIKVTHCVILTKDWFDKEINRVYEAIRKVSEANKTFWQRSSSV